MAKQKICPKPDEVLRARTKKFLAKPGPELDKIPPTEIQKLIRELQRYQVELDMQNEELRRSQGETEAALAKYADLYDSAPIGYFTFDPRGVILEANLTGVRLLGLERGSLLRTPFLAHVVPAFRPEFTAHLQKVFATRTKQFCTLQLAAPDGAAPHVTLESIAVPTEKGSLAQCRSAVSDCTARQLAEEDLRRSEEKFHLLFDQAPLGYQSLDEAGRILEVNQTWLDLMGYPREEVLGRWFGAFLKPDRPGPASQNVSPALRPTGRSVASSGRWCARTAPASSPLLTAGSSGTNRESSSGPIACSRTSPPAARRRGS